MLYILDQKYSKKSKIITIYTIYIKHLFLYEYIWNSILFLWW